MSNICTIALWLISGLMGAIPSVVAQLSLKKGKKSAPAVAVISQSQQIEAQTLYFEALTRRQTGHLDECYELLERSVSIDSTAAPALYALSDISLTMRNLPEALDWAQRAVAHDSLNFWYSINEAQLYRKLKNMPKCIESYERMMKLFPNKVEPCYDLASVYMEVDSVKDCLRVLDRIEELDGINQNITTYKFYLLQQSGQMDKAFDEYRRLIDRYPFNIDYRISLGELQMKFGNMQDAKTTFDEASAIDPNNAYLWLAQANYYNALGHTVESDSMVRAALTHPSLDVETKSSILVDYLKTSLRQVQREKQKAADTTAIELPVADSLFATVIAMHPTSPEFYSLYSEYLDAVHKDSLARVEMRYAVDLRPSDSTYWNKYIYLQMQTDDAPAIHRVATEAIRHFPSLFLAYTARAYAYSLQDSLTQTLATYMDLLQHLPPQNVERISLVWGNIGSVYQQLGNMTKTYEAYDEALKYNDKNVGVLNNYAYFLSLEKRDLAKAELMCNTVMKLEPDNATYLDTYAWVLFQQGNYILAKFYQEKAISRMGADNSADLYEHYGDILFKCGDADQAVENWQKAADMSDKPSALLLDKIRKRTYLEPLPQK